MVIKMNEERIGTIEQIEQFRAGRSDGFMLTIR
jgi:hypothetical protein